MALWTPADTTTALWLDASDSSTINIASSAVRDWDDKSGNARHAQQLTVGSRPVVVAAELNGLDVLRFATDYMLTDSIAPHSGLWTVFAVAKSTTSAAGVGNVLAQDGGTGYPRIAQYIRRSAAAIQTIPFNTVPSAFTATRTGTVTNWAIWGAVRESAAITAYYNGLAGTPVTVTGTAPTTAYAMTVGGRYRTETSTLFEGFSGDIAEIILVSGALAEADRQQFEGYLAHRYGLEGGLDAGHPYKTAAPRSHAITSTGTATLSYTVHRLLSFAHTATGSFLLDTQRALLMSFSVAATGTLAFVQELIDGAVDHTRAFSQAASAAVSMVMQVAYGQLAVHSATGSAALTKTMHRVLALGYAAVGSVARILGISKSVDVTSTGTPDQSNTVVLPVALTATATGTADVNTAYSPAPDGGIARKIRTILGRLNRLGRRI